MSDEAYELVSDRFLFAGRRSIEDSLGTRFNDIFGCSKEGMGGRRGKNGGQTIGPLVGPNNLQSYLALTHSRAATVHSVKACDVARKLS